MRLIVFAAIAIGVFVALLWVDRNTPRESAAEEAAAVVAVNSGASAASGERPAPLAERAASGAGVSAPTAPMIRTSSVRARQTAPSQPTLASAPEQAQTPAFSFRDVEYVHRSSSDNPMVLLREYTPSGQDDLAAWTDMVSLITYRNVKDGESLAEVANELYGLYESAGGRILMTDSVPMSAERPAEHLLIAVLFGHEYIEAVFTRFKMHESAGTAIVYSRRVYGRRATSEMRDWVRKHGPVAQEDLMGWDVAAAWGAQR